MSNERWDGDEAGHGISDGVGFASPLRALLEEMTRSDWNTEQPEAHLLPHLKRWIERPGSPWTLRSAGPADDVLELELDHTDARGTDLREDIYPLIATIAEPTTVIVERDEPAAHVVEVVLATIPGQAPFPRGHGHLVRLRIPRATGDPS